MEEMRNAYKVLVSKPRHSWEDIRIDLRKTEWVVVDWMHLSQDRDQ
jgi:hypothetical protein